MIEWTPKQIASLRVLWTQNLSVREIGLRLGVSKNSVASKANRLGLSKRESPIKCSAEDLERYAAPKNGCHWPIGDVPMPQFHFCGAPRQAGYIYCAEHCRIAYAPLKSGQQRVERRMLEQKEQKP